MWGGVRLTVLRSGVLAVAMWLKLSWRDHRLAWDPLQYNDVNIIRSVTSRSTPRHLDVQSVPQLPVEA